MVTKELALLSPSLREWVERHLVTPRKVILATDPDGNEKKEFCLVTDNIGYEDSSYRVAYDDVKEFFGLECTLDSGVEWFMGLFGDFPETIEHM